MPNNNRCVRRGDIVPEGMQVCPMCFEYALGRPTAPAKCSCYHERDKTIYVYNTPLKTRIGECWGTRERDECNCGGDQSKCDFYPEKRKGVSTMAYSIKSYIKEKIKILNQLNIRMTNKQLEHILSLKTEIAVDNYAHDLICKEDE